jgi:hypothetical protein
MRKQLVIGGLMIASALAIVFAGNARAADVSFHPAPAVGDVVSTYQEPYCDTVDQVKAIATAGHDSFDSLKAKFQELASAKNADDTNMCGIAPSDKVKVLSIEGTGIVTASDGKQYQTYAVNFESMTVGVKYWMLLFRGEESAPAAATKSEGM